MTRVTEASIQRKFLLPSWYPLSMIGITDRPLEGHQLDTKVQLRINTFFAQAIQNLPSIRSRLIGESGLESPSEFKLYECSVLIGAVPRAASVMSRSCKMT